MPFQAAPFVAATAGVAGIGAGAWHVLTGNTCDSWHTCAGSRKGPTWVSERSIGEISSSLYHPAGQGHGNTEGVDNHTGMSPRLSHLIETMAGTQRRGDAPNWKAQRRHANEGQATAREVSRRVSLASGLEAAFAHDDRGPTEAEAAAIRADKEAFEREQEVWRRRQAEELQRRELLLQDRHRRGLSERQPQVPVQAPRQKTAKGQEAARSPAQMQMQVQTLPSEAAMQRGPHWTQRHHQSLPPQQQRGTPITSSLVVQQEHNVEERLFAARPAFNIKRQSESTTQASLRPAGATPQASRSPSPPRPTTVPNLRSLPANVGRPPSPSHVMASGPRLKPPSPAGSPRSGSPRTFPPRAQPERGGSHKLGTSPASPARSPHVPLHQTGTSPGRLSPTQTRQLSAHASPQDPPISSTVPAGIGISLVPDQDGNLLVAHLVPGGPAMMCGQLYIGDRLLSVSGHSVAGKTVPEAIRLVLGPKGSQVVLEVVTPTLGSRVREVRIERAAPSSGPRH